MVALKETWTEALNEAELIARLEEKLKEGNRGHLEAAQYVYYLRLAGRVYGDIIREMQKRGVTVSKGWLSSLHTIWRYWVVEHGHPPSALERFSLRRLRAAANAGADLAFLEATVELSDREFAQALKEKCGAPAREDIFLVLPVQLEEDLKALAARLEAMGVGQLSYNRLVEFLVQASRYIPDETVRVLWQLITGENLGAASQESEN